MLKTPIIRELTISDKIHAESMNASTSFKIIEEGIIQAIIYIILRRININEEYVLADNLTDIKNIGVCKKVEDIFECEPQLKTDNNEYFIILTSLKKAMLEDGVSLPEEIFAYYIYRKAELELACV
jgi:hypothetical protein